VGGSRGRVHLKKSQNCCLGNIARFCPQSYQHAMVTTILSVVGAVAATVLFLQLRAVLLKVGELERPNSAPAALPPYDDAWIHVALKDLTLAVDEGIEHASRSERRVRAVINSAKRRFEAEGYVDPGLEAEATTLPLDDEGGSGGEELPPVSDDLGPTENPFQGIPGSLPSGWGLA